VPLSTASLASVLGSLFSAWLPVVPELFNQSAWWWMYCMVKLSNLATELPSGYEYIPCPTPWMFVLYYSGLAALCYGGNWPTKWKARAAVVWLILACVCLGWSHANQPEMVITIFPASAGSVVFAEGRRREATLLVDTGTTNSARFASIPFLRSRGVDRLGRLVLSHGEMRRMGGARELAMECRPDQVFASAARSRSKVYTRQLKLFANESRLRTVARGDKVGVWEVLHPEQYDKFARADDQAIVLFGTFSGIKVLLLSDLGPAGQAALLDRSPELRADLVVSGLCTKGEPLSDELLEQLKPKLIVVSDAEFPAAERARDDLRQRLKRAGCDVIYTSSSGAAVQVAIQGGKLQRLQP